MRVLLERDDMDATAGEGVGRARRVRRRSRRRGRRRRRPRASTSWSARSGRRKFCPRLRRRSSRCVRLSADTDHHRDTHRAPLCTGTPDCRYGPAGSTGGDVRRRQVRTGPAAVAGGPAIRAAVRAGPPARARARRRTTSSARSPGRRRSADSARVMTTKATVQSTAIVPSLATNPESSWSSRGDMEITFPECANGRVEGMAGEDPHDREEAGHDRLHDQVGPPSQRRQFRGPGQLVQDGRPEDEAGRRARPAPAAPARPTSGRPSSPPRSSTWPPPPPSRSRSPGSGGRPPATRRPPATGLVRRTNSGRGVPSTSSGGTASMSSSRWSTSATSSQCAARSPSGHVTAGAEQHGARDEEELLSSRRGPPAESPTSTSAHRYPAIRATTASSQTMCRCQSKGCPDTAVIT